MKSPGLAEHPFYSDSCVEAAPIGDSTLPFSTRGASFDGDGIFIASPDVWFNYNASLTGMARVDLCGSSFDTRLKIYDGGL